MIGVRSCRDLQQLEEQRWRRLPGQAGRCSCAHAAQARCDSFSSRRPAERAPPLQSTLASPGVAANTSPPAALLDQDLTPAGGVDASGAANTEGAHPTTTDSLADEAPETSAAERTHPALPTTEAALQGEDLATQSQRAQGSEGSVTCADGQSDLPDSAAEGVGPGNGASMDADGACDIAPEL